MISSEGRRIRPENFRLRDTVHLAADELWQVAKRKRKLIEAAAFSKARGRHRNLLCYLQCLNEAEAAAAALLAGESGDVGLPLRAVHNRTVDPAETAALDGPREQRAIADPDRLIPEFLEWLREVRRRRRLGRIAMR